MDYTDIIDLSIALSILMGLLACFWGQRLFKVVLAAAGFFAGGILGGTAISFVTEEQLFVLIGAAAFGVVGAVSLVIFYYVGVFMSGALVCAGVAGAALFQFVDNPERPVVMIVGIVSGLLGGVLAMRLQKLMVILGTATGGAASVVVGVTYFMDGSIDFATAEGFIRSVVGNREITMIVVCWVFLSLLGMVVQSKLAPKARK